MPGVSKRLNGAAVTIPIIDARICLFSRHNFDLEGFLPKWSMQAPTSTATWGEFTPTLQDVLSLTHLPLFREVDATGIKLEGEDHGRGSQ